MNNVLILRRWHIFVHIIMCVLFFYDQSSGKVNHFSGSSGKRRVEYDGKIQQETNRNIYLLNDGWKYYQKSYEKIEELKSSLIEGEMIDLPHTWNAFDATDNEPGYRRGAGWYSRELFIPKLNSPRVFRLYFEGVNISTDVYINREKAGSHTGGYVGFTVDITPYLKPGKLNQIDIRVDNSINPDVIPSQKSDFFIFGGIVRDVWLQILPVSFIDQLLVSTPHVRSESAETSIRLYVNNGEKTVKSYIVDARIHNARNENISSEIVKKVCPPGISQINISLPSVKKPLLWAPDAPHLHEITVKLETEKEIDSVSDRFGYRWFEFKEHGPFFINGKRLLLRGTHRHEEFAGLGSAMPDSLHRLDMTMIKEMGANFVRLAHYPQDPEIYKACDELGLLVWDELPWCRGGMGGDLWKSNTRRLLEEQIIQNYNHPSIILWSLGNELYWLPDFPDGGNPDSLKSFVSKLNDLAHALDPGRLTSLRKFYDGANITDVFSPSIWSGWYSGVYKNYETALAASREKYKRFFHAEYGGASHVGRHTESPVTGEGMLNENEWAEKPNMINIKKISSAGDWSENYLVDLFDWHLMISEQLDWLSGTAQWAFKDFGTPLRPENPIPYINQKGLVDRAGNPKDAYYVFKSYWTNTPEFCYIESPTWIERTGRPGESRQICVYSNCDEVKLFVNEEIQSLKERNINNFPACGLHWDVNFRAGENQVVAIGYVGGQEAAHHSLSLMYRTERNGRPADLILTSESMPNGHVLIKARVVDKNGLTCLEFNKRVYFDISGAGHLKAGYGTPAGSKIIEFADGRANIEFVPDKGKTVIEARTQDFKGSYIHFMDGRLVTKQ